MTEKYTIKSDRMENSGIRLRKDNVENMEFYKSYTGKKTDNVPLWWTFDTTLNLTQNGRKREFKRMQIYNRHLNYRLAQQKELLVRYKQDMQVELDRTTAAIANNAATLAEKLQELETLSRIEEIEREHELLKKEMNIKLAELNLKLSKLQLSNQEVLQEKQRKLLGEQNTYDIQIAEYEDSLIAITNEICKVDSTTEQLKQINKERASKNKELPTRRTELAVPEKLDIAAYKSLKYDNIALSIIDVTFGEKESQNITFSNLSVDILQNKTTILYSVYPHNLQYIKRLISGDYGDTFNINTGVVSMNGIAVSTMQADDRKIYCDDKMICVTQVVDILKKRPKKSAGAMCSKLINKASLSLTMRSLCLDEAMLGKHVEQLSDREIAELAAAVCISVKDKISYINESELSYSKEFIAKLCFVIQNIKEKTIIYITSNLSSVYTMSKCEIYKI